MAASVYYGRLTIPTSTGNQTVTGIVDIDGSTAFTPEAGIFWTSYIATGTAFADQGYWSAGLTDFTRQAVRSFVANKDNLTPTSSARGFSAEAYSENKVIWIRKYSSGVPPAAVVFTNVAASVVSVASGSFTLNWSATNSDQALVHFMVWGGTGVQARCGVFTAPTTAGTQSQTVTGVGFTSTGIITLNPLTRSTEYSNTGVGLDGNRLSLFGMISPSMVNLTCGGVSFGAPPSATTWRRVWRNAGWAEQKMQTSSGNPIGISASVTAISADGFTVFYDTLNSSFTSVRMPYLAFGTMPTYVGRFFQPTAPASGSSVYTGLTATLFQGAGFPASTQLNENPLPQPLRMFTGGLTARASNNQGCAFIGDASGVTTTVSVRGLSEDKCILAATPAATGSASVVYSEAEGDMATGIALDWSEANAAENEVFLMIFGAYPPPAPTPPDPIPPAPDFPPVPPPVPTGTVRPIKRLRRFPLPYDMNKEVFISRLEFIIQSGVGLSEGQGSNPQLMVRLSRDGGMTWGNEIQIGMGQQGDFSWRAYVNRLGRGRNWYCEVSGTDPVFTSFVAAFADVEGGTS